MSLTIFNKEYDGESLYDLSRDIAECFEADYNPVLQSIPADAYGFQQGKFVVTITWCEEGE